MLSFNVGSKQAFELALADISQATIQGKNEVVLEMHVDDTSGEHEVSAPPFQIVAVTFPFKVYAVIPCLRKRTLAANRSYSCS